MSSGGLQKSYICLPGDLWCLCQPVLSSKWLPISKELGKVGKHSSYQEERMEMNTACREPSEGPDLLCGLLPPGIHARPTQKDSEFEHLSKEGTVPSFSASSFETPFCSHSIPFICLERLFLHHQIQNQLSLHPGRWCLSSERLDPTCLGSTYEPGPGI